MKLLAKTLLALFAFSALGFCLAFVLREMEVRGGMLAFFERRPEVRVTEVDVVEPERVEPIPASKEENPADGWPSTAAGLASEGFADRLLQEGSALSALMLEAAMETLDVEALPGHFTEFMARDLEDRRALVYAGRLLQEIARDDPRMGVALLAALSPAERERLVPSLAKGWVLADVEGAFSWIEGAWLDEEGGYIDRDLQNELYIHALDTAVTEAKAFEQAAGLLDGVLDPELRGEMLELLARRIVADGPEEALSRIASMSDERLDTAVLDAIASEWAARDSSGAMLWTLANEQEISPSGVRSIAKQLVLGAMEESLDDFHRGLQTVPKRDAVAAEAARLYARREPLVSGDWVRSIREPETKRLAVLDALYEIGYESLSQSVDYIDYVYRTWDRNRETVLFGTLRDWLSVDRGAVASYLQSGRSGFSEAMSEELLGVEEGS